MDNSPKVLRGWSWEENKLFELALAVVDEQRPDRWEEVAAKIGGNKSAEDVQEHYVILLEDLQVIESGKLDHKLGEARAQPCLTDPLLVDSIQSLCLSDKATSTSKEKYALASRTSRVEDGNWKAEVCELSEVKMVK